MLMYLLDSEAYPVYSIKPVPTQMPPSDPDDPGYDWSFASQSVDVPEDKVAWIKATEKEWEKVQEYLASLAEHD